MFRFTIKSRLVLAVAFVVGAALSMALSAATLSVVDASGETTTLEIQSGNSVSLASAANGNLTLTLGGYYATVSSSASGGDSGSGSTDSGSSGSGSTDSGSSGSGSTDSSTYCAGNDDDLADCKATQNFDPWMTGAGEVPIWIRNKLTEVFAFTLPARSDATNVRYGYLQMTTPEGERNPYAEDVFHAWFSTTPNGAVLSGTKCEFFGRYARADFYWTQDPSLAGQVCYLGAEERVLYVNFETRCYEATYRGSGTCTADNKLKSSSTYQFDVSRRLKEY
jgi:hypothetical protein